MSDEYDILLCDPDPAAFASLLARLGLDAKEAEEIVRRTFDDPEGRRRSGLPFAADPYTRYGIDDSARYVTVAWWTDGWGRQHVRIAREPYPSAMRSLHGLSFDRDPRPPVWHVSPGRVLGVTRPPEPARWVVACSCGEVGDPEAVLWAGDRCGPCHDRREEGDPERPPDRVALHRLGAAVGELAFTDAGLFATVGGRTPGVVRLSHDGSPPVAFAPPADRDLVGPVEPMAVSDDGRFLATGHADSRVVRVADLRDGSAQLLPLAGYHGQRDIRLAFSPDGSTLVVAKQDYRVHVWEHDSRGWRVRSTDWPTARAFAFSPAGDAVALGHADGTVTVRDARTGEARETFVPDTYRRGVIFVDYLDADTLLLLLDQGDVHGHQAAMTFALSRRRAVRSMGLEAGFLSAALTPGTEYLAGYRGGGLSSPAALHFSRTSDLADVGSVEWHPEEQLTAMAFSPDGRLAAVGSRRGNVVVFPWREVLGGGRG